MGVFGKRLREVRVFRGITQEQMAEMADITRNMVGRYETTDQLTSLDTLIRIADALGISTDYLLGRTETIDEAFIVEYKQPVKVVKMPKNVTELDAFVRRIIREEMEPPT